LLILFVVILWIPKTAKINKVINVDKEILGGTPVFNGTRVPVKNLFDYLENGESISEFLSDFPTVKYGQVNSILKMSNQLLENFGKVAHENIA
jgi:uncharacterized protein (DUF433 family)